MKWIDLPPVWLLGFLVVTWWIGQVQPAGLSIAGGVAQFTAGLLIGTGVVLMALAVLALRQHRTTVIPHLEADNLVTTGVFRISRNPIYLGDALLLAGFALRWDAAGALFLVPIFMWIIQRRFILPEERRLRAKFDAAFGRFCASTGRWISLRYLR